MSKLYKNSGVDVVKTDQLIVQALKFIKSSHNKNVLGNKLGLEFNQKAVKKLNIIKILDKPYVLATINNDKAQVYKLTH